MSVSGLSAPIKRQRKKLGLKKIKDPVICCLQETHITERNQQWLRAKGWKKVFQPNRPHKQAGIAILISDKMDFRLKSVRRDNESHFILIKGTIHQEEISILNIYIPNIGKPNYFKKY
jgi:exonuclease III